jgi:Na+/melibiose symporter-like transporter
VLNQVTNPETADSAYKSLYRLGGVAALIVVVLTLSEVIGHTLYPQPGTVSGWFELFQSNKIIGLLDFWGLEVPMYMMFAVVYLALYVVLRKASASRMAVALTFALLGVGIFLATNNPFSMLSLSNEYAVATTEAQRSAFLAAGQAILANTGQRAVGGFNGGLFLVSVAGLIASSVMLRGNSFSRLTAYVGIVANGLSLADYLRQALTPSATIAVLLILPNALFLVIWYVLVGRRLFQLGRLERRMLPEQP